MAKFLTSEIREVQKKLNDMWRDAQINAEFQSEVDGLLAIKANSSAKFPELEDPRTDNKVSINWITGNNIVAVPKVANCDISGPELDSAKKTYELDIFQETSFSVNEDDLRGSIFSKEEVVAQGLLLALKALDEKLATIVLAKADSFAGSNQYLGGFTETNGKTVIPANTPAVNFFAYLDQARIINRMRDSFLIENGTMYQQQVIAAYNSGNLDGKGAQAAFGSMKVYTDFFNMVGAGLTTDALLINRSALAFANRAMYSEVPIEYGGDINETRYSIASKKVPGVRYDVRYKMKCEVNAAKNQEETRHIWQIRATAGLFLNPVFTAAKTGVIAFDRV